MLAQAKILQSAFRSSHGLAVFQRDLHLRAASHALAANASDSVGTTLVVGGGRGLGLEFVKQLLDKPQHKCVDLLTDTLDSTLSMLKPCKTTLVYPEVNLRDIFL